MNKEMNAPESPDDEKGQPVDIALHFMQLAHLIADHAFESIANANDGMRPLNLSLPMMSTKTGLRVTIDVGAQTAARNAMMAAKLRSDPAAGVREIEPLEDVLQEAADHLEWCARDLQSRCGVVDGCWPEKNAAEWERYEGIMRSIKRMRKAAAEA